jgi:phage terminase small subunit
MRNLRGSAKNTADTPLNLQEKLFVNAYLNNGRRGSTAAITAGYSKKAATVQSCKMMQRPNIIAAIEAHDKKIVTTIKKSVKGSAAWKRRKLIKIADELSSVLDAKTAKAIIGAIAELNKMDGHYSAEKVINANLNIDSDLQKVAEESRRIREAIDKHRSEY